MGSNRQEVLWIDMKIEENINDFLGMPYQVTITRKGDVFVLFIRELGLMAHDSDLGGAYLQIESKKREYLEEMCQAGLESEIPLPRQLVQSRAVFDDLKLFLLKLAIVCLVMLAAAAFTVREVEHYAVQIKKKIELKLAGKENDPLANAVRSFLRKSSDAEPAQEKP